MTLFVVAVETTDSASLETLELLSDVDVGGAVDNVVGGDVEEVRTISLYSLTIPLRLIIFSELVRDPADSDECSWLLGAVVVNAVDGARGDLLAGVDVVGCVVVVVVLEVLPESEMKGRRILRFLILSLLSGRCGTSSSVLGDRGVVFPLA